MWDERRTQGAEQLQSVQGATSGGNFPKWKERFTYGCQVNAMCGDIPHTYDSKCYASRLFPHLASQNYPSCSSVFGL